MNTIQVGYVSSKTHLAKQITGIVGTIVRNGVVQYTVPLPCTLSLCSKYLFFHLVPILLAFPAPLNVFLLCCPLCVGEQKGFVALVCGRMPGVQTASDTLAPDQMLVETLESLCTSSTLFQVCFISLSSGHCHSSWVVPVIC